MPMPRIIRTTHTYEIMHPDMRPQDPHLDGTGLTFETLEHGGAYPDEMPQAILMMDAEGRSCTYVPIKVEGQTVRSHGFNVTSDEDEDRPLPPPIGMGMSDPVIWPFIRRLFRRR